MIKGWRYLRLFTSYCLLGLMIWAACKHEMFIYLVYQGKGQLDVLQSRVPMEEYARRGGLSERERESLRLVQLIKKYSEDSLDYRHTENYSTICDQEKMDPLWVITASEPYRLRAYYWEFPLVGRVSYKGFFRKDLAEKERDHLRSLNYDVDMRTVTAWSTLGWFSDPVMSRMLRRNKAALCDLLFHELFHATYYVPNNVDLNENLATFVAKKATLQFLRGDSISSRAYLRKQEQNKVFERYMTRKSNELRAFYDQNKEKKDLPLLKIKWMLAAADSVKKIGLDTSSSGQYFRSILQLKNAWFIDFGQYNIMQDSLEKAFNKFYGGDLKKLVQDLKQE